MRTVLRRTSTRLIVSDNSRLPCTPLTAIVLYAVAPCCVVTVIIDYRPSATGNNKQYLSYKMLANTNRQALDHAVEYKMVTYGDKNRL